MPKSKTTERTERLLKMAGVALADERIVVKGVGLQSHGDDLFVTLTLENGREIPVIREYAHGMEGIIGHHVSEHGLVGIIAGKRECEQGMAKALAATPKDSPLKKITQKRHFQEVEVASAYRLLRELGLGGFEYGMRVDSRMRATALQTLFGALEALYPSTPRLSRLRKITKAHRTTRRKKGG